MLKDAALKGALAGAVGVTAMTAGEKLEQRLTGRPNSFVPGRTFSMLFGRRPAESEQPLLPNLTVHYSQGIMLGALRGVWSQIGLRGPTWSSVHTVVRLALDQTLENAARTGAPPATWPRRELEVDLLHKAVYSAVTGWLCDRMVPVEPRPLPGRVSH